MKMFKPKPDRVKMVMGLDVGLEKVESLSYPGSSWKTHGKNGLKSFFVAVA